MDGMHCVACGGVVTSDGTALQSGHEVGQTSSRATHGCLQCGRYPTDQLLQLLTRLASCGLTAASPALLESASSID
jgi:hypothetical protein